MFTPKQNQAFLHLFHMAARPTQPPHMTFSAALRDTSIRYASFADCINKNVIFVTSNGELLREVPVSIAELAINMFGIPVSNFNATFYRSFSTVEKAEAVQLLFDQMLHYLTTYGAEAAGVSVPTYIPRQALDLPKSNSDKITVITLATEEECIEKLNAYVKTLTAPSQAIISSLTNLIPLISIPTDDIKSFEVQVLCYRALGTVPTEPITQLRYLVYALTQQTLLIKNKEACTAIKNAAHYTGKDAHAILSRLNLERLSSIFLRFKPIFLALKAHNGCAPIINRLRRLAIQNHKPLEFNCLQNLAHVSSISEQRRIIAQASNRDLIKVLNFLQTRLFPKTNESIYQIRNSKVFVTESKLSSTQEFFQLSNRICNTLIERLTPSIKDKIFYIPSYISYALPTSEKQFIGNIPFGSFIQHYLDKAMTIGVHWFNQSERTDIDLHLCGPHSTYGWNGLYRDTSIIYTGDQTTAPEPNGAAEAFYLNPKQQDTLIAQANLYSGMEAKFSLFMTETEPDTKNRNYTFNPADVLFPPIPLKFSKGLSAMTIGMLYEGRFYFCGGTPGNNIVPQGNYEAYIGALINQLTSKFNLGFLIQECGGTIVDEPVPDAISLAPEDLTPSTLLDIVDGSSKN